MNDTAPRVEDPVTARVDPAALAELARLRERYPAGLFCTSPLPCPHRMLATSAAGWAASWPGLPSAERETRRQSFVCADCRAAGEARERVTSARRVPARWVLSVPRNPVGVPLPGDLAPLSRNVAESRHSQGGFSGTLRRGGRPRLPAEERRRRERERKRRWRAGDLVRA